MRRRTLLTLMGVLGATSSVICLNRSAYAIEDYSPSVTVSVGSKVGFSNLSAPNGTTDVANYYVPVNINVDNISKYFVSVYMDCNGSTNASACQRGELVNGDNSMVGVDGSKTLTGMNNEWGYRYNMGSTASKPDGKYFSAMATSRDSGWIDNGEGGTAFLTNSTTNSDRKVLTLDFGAAVGSSAVSGTYTGKAVVAVVATPIDVTFALLGITSNTIMQSFTAEQCRAIDIGQEGALKDARDNKVYKVAKLADNNCWMIQNLALDSGTTEATRRTITGADSDLASTSDTYKLPISSTSGFNNSNAVYMFNATHQDDTYDTLGYDGSGANQKDGENSGGYYSWLVATAQTSDTSSSGEATTSICPKRWKLPSSGAGNEYVNLVNSYADGGGKTRKQNLDATWHPGYGGIFADGALGGSGSLVHWWSRTIISATSVYTMYEFRGATVNPTFTSMGHRGYGAPIRCIFRP